jgi:general secretion pathway protein J
MRPRSRGFTLIELLVAISVMAMMALLSWRGIDGMSRAQNQLQARADDTLTLQVGLAQWRTDLDAMLSLAGTPAMDWDGRVLRVSRRHPLSEPASLQVVAWTLRDGQWLRWQSPAISQRADWAAAWSRAQTWAQTPTAEDRTQEVAVRALSQWQIFFHRGGAWSNPLSSEGTASNAAAGSAPLPGSPPDGIRLVLELPPGISLSGKLTLDWVNPVLTGAAP